jgi:hypothetical protein
MGSWDGRGLRTADEESALYKQTLSIALRSLALLPDWNISLHTRMVGKRCTGFSSRWNAKSLRVARVT